MNKAELSKTKISSFEGNIVTLQLLSNEDISKEDINWISSDESIVYIRDFKTSGEPLFSDGVLLTLIKKGNAKITAEYNGQSFDCFVEVREIKKAKENDSFNFYFSDFHAHTSSIHKKPEFEKREDTNPYTVLRGIRKEGFFDSYTISDHACLVNNKEFFNVFLAAEEAEKEGFIAFPGTESEIENIKTDIHGVPHKNAGEVVTFNSHGWAAVQTWEEYFEKVYKNPYATACFNHPQILGKSVKGIWNFSFEKVIRPEMKEMFRMIEMGNGWLEKENLIHERMYTRGLDCGLRLSPACNSDYHGPAWGKDARRGKTILMAPEKDKELFMDAVRNNRLVATENGKTMIWYTVNGKITGADIPLCDTYEFNVGISYMEKPDKGEKVMHLEVISDYGKILKILPLDGSKDINVLDFTIKSDSARYFYLKVVSEEGDRTWSSPVWTGREFDKLDSKEFNGNIIDKSTWKIDSVSEGVNPGGIISDDVEDFWKGENTEAEIVIDLGKTTEISAVGICPHSIVPKDDSTTQDILIAGFISDFEIYLGCEEKNYTRVYNGTVYSYGEEKICEFEKSNARYIKIKVLNTTGSTSYKPLYMDKPVMIGSVYAYNN